jgi:CBS-domain-containing membrane protein
LDVEIIMSPKALKEKRVRRADNRGTSMPQIKPRKLTRDVMARMSPKQRAETARSLTCGETMLEAHWVWFDASMVDVIDDLTSNNWDHVFVINHEGAPQGRIHAVDVLKIIARKKVNRDIAWMHSIPAQQLVNLPPITVNMDTPLLKAGALMLAHDLNQIGVVNHDGALVGVVGHNTMARHMPKFIL